MEDKTHKNHRLIKNLKILTAFLLALEEAGYDFTDTIYCYIWSELFFLVNCYYKKGKRL